MHVRRGGDNNDIPPNDTIAAPARPGKKEATTEKSTHTTTTEWPGRGSTSPSDTTVADWLTFWLNDLSFFQADELCADFTFIESYHMHAKKQSMQSNSCIAHHHT